MITAHQKVALKGTLGPKGVNNKTAVHWNVVNVKTNTVFENRVALGLENKMKPIVNIGDAESKKNGKPKWVVEGTNDTEKVTYTVSRKGSVSREMPP